jgi:hypothetical protein
MPATLDISYYNTFLLKQVTEDAGEPEGQTNNPVWPRGFPYNASIEISETIGPFPGTASNTDAYNSFYLEESRIRGGYNNTSVDFGVKAYLVDENPQQQHRQNSLIWSGIFNSRTGVNNSNQFSVGESITKSVDPAEGSIQKLHAEDTNLIILQENQVNRAPINKDIIYNAEGGGALTASNAVIGTISAYSGEYGISRNPESFAVYGYQKYFTDKDRNVVLRLSNNGLTEISANGMVDYFRDQLSGLPEYSTLQVPATVLSGVNNVITLTSVVENIQKGMSFTVNGIAQPNNIVIDINGSEITVAQNVVVSTDDELVFSTPFKGVLIGGYDIHNKNYVLSIQQKPTWAVPLAEDVGTGSSANYNTLAFDERINGWTSYFTYKPTFISSLKNDFYSFKEGKIYKHYSEADGLNRGNFYGIYSPSKITFIFNDQPSLSKNFQTVNYEGDNGWQVDLFTSDKQGPDYSSPWGDWGMSQDITNASGGISVKSYLGGAYDSTGNTFPTTLIPPIYYHGFERKENKYYAIIYNNSAPTSGEVIHGQQVSGIKGRFATVTMSTDDITQVGGAKELWSVGSKYVASS